MAKPLTNTKTSKPGPKDPKGVNEIILLLSIHFKKCLGDEHYAWVASLLNLCPFNQGKKWTEGSVKMRVQRLRKAKDWSQQFEKRDYLLWRYNSRDTWESSGLSELISKYLSKRGY